MRQYEHGDLIGQNIFTEPLPIVTAIVSWLFQEFLLYQHDKLDLNCNNLRFSESIRCCAGINWNQYEYELYFK